MDGVEGIPAPWRKLKLSLEKKDLMLTRTHSRTHKMQSIKMFTVHHLQNVTILTICHILN